MCFFIILAQNILISKFSFKEDNIMVENGGSQVKMKF